MADVALISLIAIAVAVAILASVLKRRRAPEFSRQLLEAQEAERSRLARELHDDISQRLARLAIDAGRFDGMHDQNAQAETMREVRDGLVRLSEDVHTLAYKLHPALLERLGLANALKVECERFSRQQSIAVAVNLSEIPAGVLPETALCLFRITQEALRNVALHSRAKTAEVSLQPLDRGLKLKVTDTGAGFNPGDESRRASLGLASMRERARLVGGKLEIESTPGHGTTVSAWVPLNDSIEFFLGDRNNGAASHTAG